MHVLTFREAYARLHHGSNEVALLRDAQRAFLQDHLSRWVPTFARLVGRKGEGLYRLLADLVAACIAFEAASFGLSPGEEVELAPSVSLDPDESLLPCGAERCPLEPLP
jgi:TorA maturation chaperone TorD